MSLNWFKWFFERTYLIVVRERIRQDYFVKTKKKLTSMMKTTKCYLNIGSFRLRIDML